MLAPEKRNYMALGGGGSWGKGVVSTRWGRRSMNNFRTHKTKRGGLKICNYVIGTTEGGKKGGKGGTRKRNRKYHGRQCDKSAIPKLGGEITN